MKFLRNEDGFNYFDFVCEGCCVEGEIGFPDNLRIQRLHCPQNCGAEYVQWINDGVPDLMGVVIPVFDDAA